MMIGILCGVKEKPDTDQAYGYLLEQDFLRIFLFVCLFLVLAYWYFGMYVR